MLNFEVGSDKTKNVKFGQVGINKIFYVWKKDFSERIVECEKLTNNLAEDEFGNTFFMSSSDAVEINLIETMNV